MANPGDFIWYELITRDPGAAERFYCEVVGWRVSDYPGGESNYRVWWADESGIGGVMAMPASSPGMAPGWFGYLWVADVDAAVASVSMAGGLVRMPATDLPGVGRIAMLTDPQGVPFYVMTPTGEGESHSFSLTKPGHVGWNELSTDDVAGALRFYQREFGWTLGEPVSMGDLGHYEILLHGASPIGGAMPCMNERLPAAWTFYFRVPDIEAAADRIRAGGGKVLHGPADVPGGSRIVIALDPQAALFGLVA